MWIGLRDCCCDLKCVTCAFLCLLFAKDCSVDSQYARMAFARMQVGMSAKIFIRLAASELQSHQ